MADTYPYGVAPWPRFYACDDQGLPLVGGKVSIFHAGTTSYATVYNHLDEVIANPVTLGADAQADIFLEEGDSMYRIVVESADGVLIYTADNVSVKYGDIGTAEGPKGDTGPRGAQGGPGPEGARGYTGLIGDAGPDAEFGSGDSMWRRPGGYTFNLPPGTSNLIVTLVGGGGGGAYGKPGNIDISQPRGGDGGGGGGHGEVLFQQSIDVAPDDLITMVVGEGGDTEEDGSDTYLLINAVEVLRAKGGLKGSEAQLATNPTGAHPGGIGYYLVFAKAASSGVADTTVMQQIVSIAGHGGHAATSFVGQGGEGGVAGLAPSEPVTVYSEPLMNGRDGTDASGNGCGGGGGGGGAVYAYGMGTHSTEDEIPTFTTLLLPTQPTSAECTPVGGTGGKGGKGAPGMVWIKFRVDL